MKKLSSVVFTLSVLAAGCGTDSVERAVEPAAVPTSVTADVGEETTVVDEAGADTPATADSNNSEPVTFAPDQNLVASWSQAGTAAVGGATELSVADFGAVPDDGNSDSAAFSAAVQAARQIDDSVTITVGEGDYLLTRTLDLTDGVSLAGQGPTSRIVIDFGGQDGPGISATGTIDGGWVALGEAPVRGGTTVVVGGGSSFQPGDVIEIEQKNEESFYIRPEWRVDWGQGATGELNRVEAVDGRTLTLEAPINADYHLDLGPKIRTIDAVEQVGIQDLSLFRAGDGYGATVRFELAADVWFDRVTTERTSRAHIGLNQTFRCRISDSTIHDASDFGDGGRAYGISLARHTTGCLVTNNTLYDLRHAIIVQLGASGNVVAYNHARGSAGYEDRQPRADVSLHGHLAQANLFEGNIVDRAVSSDWWGPSGPTNTLYRNCIRDHVIITNQADGQVVVGNVIGDGGLRVDDNITGEMLVGNYVLSAESAAAGGLEQPAPVDGPESLWTDLPPDFLDGYAWPPIDPSRDGSACALPASDRSPLGNN